MKRSPRTITRILTAAITAAALTGALLSTGCGPSKPDGGRTLTPSNNDTQNPKPISATIGVACTDNSPCGTEGTCMTEQSDGTYKGGYCTADCSDTNKSCPTGSTCQTVDGAKKCMLTCGSSGSTCRTPDYTCDTTKNVCLPTAGGPQNPGQTTPIVATIGVACTDNSPCGKEGTCLTEQSNGTYKGGYCTADCSDTTKSCPDGSTCQTVDGAKKCMLTCGAGGATCRTPGYKCDLSLKVCLTEPPPTTVKINATIGVACTDNSPCGTEGRCITEKSDGTYKDGYCSADCSDASKSCPDGSKCRVVDGAKMCMTDCSGGKSCRSSFYECSTTDNICLPRVVPTGALDINRVGYRCNSSQGCGGNDGLCIEEKPDGTFKGGYCSGDCSSAACPKDSKCVEISGEGKRCIHECGLDDDCGDDYQCDTTQKVCLPKSGSPPAPSKSAKIKTCSVDSDCDGGLKCKSIKGVRYPGYAGSAVRICTHDCSSDSNSCPNNSVCQKVINEQLCFPTCDPNKSDSCSSVMGTNDFACGKATPSATENTCHFEKKDIGEECSKDDDCREYNKTSKCYIYDPANSKGICQGICYGPYDCPDHYLCDNRKPNDRYGICRPDCTFSDTCNTLLPNSKCIFSIGYDSDGYATATDPNGMKGKSCYLPLKSNTDKPGDACKTSDQCGVNSTCMTEIRRDNNASVTDGFCLTNVYKKDGIDEPCPTGTVAVNSLAFIDYYSDSGTTYEKELAMCAKPCTGDSTCRGGGYKCKDRDTPSGGTAKVCLPDPFPLDLIP